MPKQAQATDIKRTDKPAGRLSGSPSKTEESLTATTVLVAEQIQPQAHTDARMLNPHEVLRLQRTLGNRAVNRLLATRSIQAKLSVGAADDQYEQEADQIAAQVMRTPAVEEEEIQTKPLAAMLTPVVQRAAQENEEEIQTLRTTAANGFDTSADFENRLSATRSSGSPLPDPVREFMEPRFGADFGSVRVHTDSESAQLNREVSAQAFTQGSDIYLGEGKTDLASKEGQHLLAHELTHVVQQTGSIERKAVPEAGSTLKDGIGVFHSQMQTPRTLLTAGRVQRRVPQLDQLDQLGTDPLLLKKLRKTVSRTVNDQSATVQDQLKLKLATQDIASYIRQATAADLKQLIIDLKPLVETDIQADITKAEQELSAVLTTDTETLGKKEKQLEKAKARGKSPLEHPGAESTFVPWNVALADVPSQKRFRELIAEAQAILKRAGQDHAALLRVFGSEKTTPYADWAQPVFADAASALGRLLTNNMIGADLSGEGRELCRAGMTGTTRMMLDGAIFENLADTSHDQERLYKICHESFHAASANIDDRGGYRHEATFAERQAKDKILSAPHYEEVIWQVENWPGSEKRTLVPKSTSTTSDVVGTGRQEAMDYIRNAWVQALRNHDDLKASQLKQKTLTTGDLDLPERNKLTYNSMLEGWSLHKRLGAQATYPPITDLDVTLSEGVTGRLGKAYGVELPKAPKTTTAWETANKPKLPWLSWAETKKNIVKENLIDEALQKVGPIRTNLIRDKAMVEGLNAIFDKKVDTATVTPVKLPR
jgi:hypothetical protein